MLTNLILDSHLFVAILVDVHQCSFFHPFKGWLFNSIVINAKHMFNNSILEIAIVLHIEIDAKQIPNDQCIMAMYHCNVICKSDKKIKTNL